MSIRTQRIKKNDPVLAQRLFPTHLNASIKLVFPVRNLGSTKGFPGWFSPA